MDDRQLFKPNDQLYDTPYIVEKNIGAGGDGFVYIIHEKNNPNKKYAAKIFIKPDELTDAYWKKRGNEAITAMRVSQKPNPNLARTYDAFVTEDNYIVFIMDYIDGLTLRSYLDIQGCLTPRVALGIFKKLLNGVKQLHSYKQKIIHRDLKPDNIMVSYDLSTVVIIDFSISSVVYNEGDKTKILTTEKHLHGTSSYISPELYDVYYGKNKDNKTISVQSDFFSLGIILYEMIMGTLPFNPVLINNDPKKQNVLSTIRLPLTYDMINISANPTIPTSLENLIFRCIASKPQDITNRYNDIDEIIADVEKCLQAIDKKNDSTPLLKPLNRRIYQADKLINTDVLRQDQKWYKQWWFFAAIFSVGLTIIIVAIIAIFVI